MFCKYCGTALTGSLCPKCGKETVLSKSSSELDKLMLGRKIEKTTVKVPEKTYQQGYDEGYRAGTADGYKKGAGESKMSCQKTMDQEKLKIRRLVLIICGAVFLLSAVLSGIICGKISYNSGYNNAIKEVREEYDIKIKEEYERGSKKGYDNGYIQGKADRDAEIEAAKEEENKTSDEQDISQQSDAKETNEQEVLFSRTVNNGTKEEPSEEIKQIQTRLQELGYLKDTADGIIGSHTESAIREFQKKSGLTETGAIDRITYKMLLGEEQDTENQETEEPETNNAGSDDDAKEPQAPTAEESPLPNVYIPGIVLPSSADTQAEENQATSQPDTSL